MANDIKVTVTESNGRRRASSGSPWEPTVGYARAVRAGNTIAITGTVGINADGTFPKSPENDEEPRS
jgi:enamine deaminase RidA (YjgF/YER057c/UK114 family)